VLLLAFALALTGCRSTTAGIEKPKKPRRGKAKQEQVAEAVKEAKPVGKVVHVDVTFGFVLVDVGLLTGFVPGMEVQSRQGEAVTAVLRITPEALRPFLTADIVQGKPQIGDIIYKAD
jgi:hypothetical protein